jgi:hypothetical protein
MAIKKRAAKPFIDLLGPGGNAFALLGHAQNMAIRLGLDHEAIMADMESSDYDHLIEVFDKHFGDYVDLLR